MPHVPRTGNTVRANHSQSIRTYFGVLVGSSPAMFVSHGFPLMIEVVRLVWFHHLAEALNCFGHCIKRVCPCSCLHQCTYRNLHTLQIYQIARFYCFRCGNFLAFTMKKLWEWFCLSWIAANSAPNNFKIRREYKL